MSEGFWDYLQILVDTSKIIIDRPKGSLHQHYQGKPYPLDYGYLEGTSSIDMGGIDIWIGSGGEKKVVGIVCTVDLQKKDTELKILVGCSAKEIAIIMEFVNLGNMRAVFVPHD